MKNNVLVWISGIDNLMSTTSKNQMIGGLQVQMYMWSTTFVVNGWKVYSFTKNKKNANKVIDKINYLKYPSIRYINPIFSLLFAIYTVIKIKPHLILVNGATRDLFITSLISKILGIKIIFIFASDTDGQPGKELIYQKYYKIFFRWGMKMTDNFIVQNINQANLLNKNYNKTNYIIIPNIWVDNFSINQSKIVKNKILWVSNIRTFKRPEWFIKLAKENPQYNFVMVGHSYDKSLYNVCKEKAYKLSNLDFMGGLSFTETSKLFRQAHLFVCTSEIEGFPNTFVQAWMNSCPIVTTFDPSNLIKSFKLGIYCDSFEDVSRAIQVFEEKNFYRKVQKNIDLFFKNNYSNQMQYDKIVEKFMPEFLLDTASGTNPDQGIKY